ncbi:hypothetical protein BpHYR1_046860 [Brachionus plicatilis]|uniref:Uncharacterized protein n=1 Tax=Brachionus plicatilis TaxID=10195 RepID=A0A3M7RFR5_BRAPC|nr:hypothetical protein BpHYR1_046860 [Brachionus plicatilis]
MKILAFFKFRDSGTLKIRELLINALNAGKIKAIINSQLIKRDFQKIILDWFSMVGKKVSNCVFYFLIELRREI